jgi:hypothetical protein
LIWWPELVHFSMMIIQIAHHPSDFAAWSFWSVSLSSAPDSNQTKRRSFRYSLAHALRVLNVRMHVPFCLPSAAPFYLAVDRELDRQPFVRPWKIFIVCFLFCIISKTPLAVWWLTYDFCRL